MALLDYAPEFTTAEAVEIAHRLFAIPVAARTLPSERDQNFLLTLEDGEKRILKIANAREDPDLLEAENAVMLHVAGRGAAAPRPFPTLDGDFVTRITGPNGNEHCVRLISFLPGRPMGEVRRHSAGLLHDLGRRVGQLNRALADFDHPAAHRDLHWDLAHARREIERHKSLIDDPALRSMIDSCVAGFERDVEPLLGRLRSSVIHNDANDYNVIVGGGDDLYSRDQQVIGLIDFGDLVHTWTVADLAIAIAYAILDKPDPLTAAAHVVRGYHAEYPLTETELAALFGLVRMRLCVSVCLAAHQQRQRPDDPYLVISQAPIRNTLPRLAAIHSRFAAAAFREACGLAPVPEAGPLTAWLRSKQKEFAPVLGIDLTTEPCLVFDFSPGSPFFEGDPEGFSEPEMTARLFRRMAKAGARVGVGRYDEPRLVYSEAMFAGGGEDPSAERRTLHIGLDLFAPADTPVYAPLPGIVHTATVNPAPQDYGGVVILEHATSTGLAFFTLYGHLNPDALAGLKAGQTIAAGQQFATLGTAAGNGGWSPHLHLQILPDLLELDNEFPGVVRVSQREVWAGFSLDPNLIVGVPEERFPATESSKAETLATRRKRAGASLSLGYREPIKMVRGWQQYLYDDTGRKYLDAYNNVPQVGHCHPRVVAAAHQQMAVLNTNTRYLQDQFNRYAERLASTLPEPLDVCFFVNSGSEANELALRLARARTGQRDMIVLEGAYHGHTTSLIDISPYKHDGPGGSGAPAWVHTAPVADAYRGRYKSDDARAGEKYARHVLHIVQRLEANGRAPAGFIAESCPSVGGQIIFPPGYLGAVYRHVRGAGGLCIADEIQTGYGRTGTHFYAFEAQDVVPDIVVLGKPIGNGHPVAAVVTTTEIAAAFANGMEFFSTFGGNTVSCAVGLAVLDVTLSENLQAHALEVGTYLLGQLRSLQSRYPLIGDVRGSGLFLGVELVRDRDTLEPAAAEASFICDRLRDQSILIGTDGPYHNVLKIRPPLPFDKSNADFLVSALAKILAEDFG